MGSPKGIGMVSPKDLDDFDGGAPAPSRSRLHERRRMKTEECFGHWQPSIWKTAADFSGSRRTRGRVDRPEGHQAQRSSPPVLIQEVVVDQKAQPLDSRLCCRPGRKSWSSLHGSQLPRAPQVLSGTSSKATTGSGWKRARGAWPITPTSGRNYTFRVMACNNDGLWNESGAEVGFYLTPHFYQTFWFYGACACLLFWRPSGSSRCG